MGDFEEGLRGQRIPLDECYREVKAMPCLGIAINLIYREGRDKAIIGLKKKAAEILARRGVCLMFCELFTVTILWSVLRQDYEVALFGLTYLMLMLCEIVYV